MIDPTAVESRLSRTVVLCSDCSQITCSRTCQRIFVRSRLSRPSMTKDDRVESLYHGRSSLMGIKDNNARGLKLEDLVSLQTTQSFPNFNV